MHNPTHNETLDSILNFLDAQRPTAPSDATRVDQPEAYLSEGEMISPQSSQEPWVGEAVTDVLHYFGVKDQDPGVATEQKEALSGAIDLFSPQGLGGLMLMGAGPVVNVAKKLTGSAARAARAASRKPVKYIEKGEKGYLKEYKVDSVYKDAGSKLPAVSQKPGVRTFQDNRYNYVESVKKRSDGLSIHSIGIRPVNSFHKSDDLGTLKFNVQAVHPTHKGMFKYERDHFDHIIKGGDVSALNNEATQMALSAQYNLDPYQGHKLIEAIKRGTWTDEAIEMVAGKNLKQPKLIHNVCLGQQKKAVNLRQQKL